MWVWGCCTIHCNVHYPQVVGFLERSYLLPTFLKLFAKRKEGRITKRLKRHTYVTMPRQCDHDNDSPYSLTPLLPLALPVPRVSRGLQSSETTERVDTVTQTAARIIRLLDILIIATECLKSEIVHKWYTAQLVVDLEYNESMKSMNYRQQNICTESTTASVCRSFSIQFNEFKIVLRLQ